MAPELRVIRPGVVPYREALEAQKGLERRRIDGEVPDLLVLLEHPPTYTKGRRATPEELPMGESWYEMQGIEVTETDRGGRVTYHGPGQLVGYPIVSLRPYRNDVRRYVESIERVMISSLGEWGVEAQCAEGETGVWVGDRKIGSIGVHVSRGVTTHGFAVNVNNDLQPFEWIVPCGIEGGRFTSLSRELGAEQDIDAFSETIVRVFAQLFGRDPAPAAAEDAFAPEAGVSG